MNEAAKIEKARKATAAALVALASYGWGGAAKNGKLKQRAYTKLQEALKLIK